MRPSARPDQPAPAAPPSVSVSVSLSLSSSATEGGAPRPRGRRSAGWPGAALVAVAIWGASFVAVRVGLRSFTPFGLVAGRFVMGAGILLGVLAVRGQSFLPRPGDRGRGVLLGLVLGTHMSLQAFGLQHTSAIHTGWIIAFTSVIIALGAHLFLRDRLGALGWGGVAVALGGVAVVSGGGMPGFERAMLGDSLQVLSCFTWAFYTLVGMGSVARNGALRVTAFSMVVASVPLSLLAMGGGFAVRTPGVEEWGALCFLGLCCSALALVLWYASQRVHGAQRTAATLYLEPLFTVVVAMLVLGETIAWPTVIGGGVVLGGVWMVKRGSMTPA